MITTLPIKLMTWQSVITMERSVMASSYEYGSTTHRMDSGIKLDRKEPTTLPALAEEPPEIVDPKPEPAPARKPKPKEMASTRDQFNGTSTPIQLKLDSELIQSLKLHAIDSGKTMSEIVMECMTSKQLVKRAWISTRQSSS